MSVFRHADMINTTTTTSEWGGKVIKVALNVI